MKRDLLRVALVGLALAAIAVAGASPAIAASPTPVIQEDDPAWDCATMGNRTCGPTEEPTLGVSVQSRVYLDVERVLRFANRSDVAETFTFVTSGGWSVDPAEVTLDGGAESHVVIVGDGEDGATIEVTVIAAAPPPEGRSPVTITLGARVYHEQPFDPTWLILRVLAAALVVVAVVLVLRRVRPWEFRLQRRVP